MRTWMPVRYLTAWDFHCWGSNSSRIPLLSLSYRGGDSSGAFTRLGGCPSVAAKGLPLCCTPHEQDCLVQEGGKWCGGQGGTRATTTATAITGVKLHCGGSDSSRGVTPNFENGRVQGQGDRHSGRQACTDAPSPYCVREARIVLATGGQAWQGCGERGGGDAPASKVSPSCTTLLMIPSGPRTSSTHSRSLEAAWRHETRQ
jgi:hypothetical protein